MDQPAAAAARATLGFLNKLPAAALSARPFREPEQLDVALLPIRLQNQAADDCAGLAASGKNDARVVEPPCSLLIEPAQSTPQLAGHLAGAFPFRDHPHLAGTCFQNCNLPLRQMPVILPRSIATLMTRDC